MIPQHVLSTLPVPAPFLPPDNIDRPDLLTDYEMGGADIRDPSQGLQVQVWTFTYHDGGVYAEGESIADTLLFLHDDVTEISGAFDQNMNPAVAFVTGDVVKLWWFDTIASAQVFTTFEGIRSPKVTLDDKRPLETLAGSSDVIFCYMRGQTLCSREQRDRYSVEYQLSSIPEGFTFEKFGMGTVLRLQWSFLPPETDE